MPSKTKARRPPIAPKQFPRVQLVTLDVSSNAAGVAWFEPDGTLSGFSTIMPRRGVDPHVRIDEIVRRVLVQTLPQFTDISELHFLMEWSSGQVHGRQMRTRTPGAGLSTLGQAQGQVRQALIGKTGRKPWLVCENVWTLSKRKEDRARLIRLEFPAYAAYHAAGKDPGLDSADSIGIGLWYYARAKEQELETRLREGA